MKTTIIFCLLFIVFSAGKCKKEGENCHYDITIVNNSTQDVIAAYLITNPENKCILNGGIILKNENFEHNLRNCWEHRLSNSITYNLFIVDPNHYNNPLEFYSCDSIRIKNTVLKEYVLTLEDLKIRNFTINYP